MKIRHIPSFLMVSLLVGACFLSTSCRGAGGKKAATEAVEYVERKAATMGDDASRLSRESEEEYSSYSNYRKARKLQDRIDRISEEDEETGGMSQPVTIPCPHCQGNGMVYVTDTYGNMMFDYYGNPQVTYCPQCGGTKQVTLN